MMKSSCNGLPIHSPDLINNGSGSGGVSLPPGGVSGAGAEQVAAVGGGADRVGAVAEGGRR